MTVAELLAELRLMPKDVTVMFTDGQNGDRIVQHVVDSETYSDGARIVRLS